jgi:NADH-quinone oxidoreductase chain I
MELSRLAKKIFIIDLAQGLKTTLKHLFRKPITIQYPKERWTPYKRYRGLHVLKNSQEGKDLCIGCGLCARSCPSNAIEVVTSGKGKERKLEKYTIDLSRCIYCGFCVEVCPQKALEMSQFYELATYCREKLLADKEYLSSPHISKKYKK